MRRIRCRDPLRGVERLAVDEGRIIPAKLILDGGESLLHLPPTRLLAEVGEGLVLEAGFRSGRRRSVVEQESRIHQQLLLGNVVGEARPQKRRVGGVLEQPANQVRHAGQKLAERRVDADALAEPDQGVLHRVGHAVEHLNLEAAVGGSPIVWASGQGVSQAADVMAGERRPQASD